MRTSPTPYVQEMYIQPIKDHLNKDELENDDNIENELIHATLQMEVNTNWNSHPAP